MSHPKWNVGFLKAQNNLLQRLSSLLKINRTQYLWCECRSTKILKKWYGVKIGWRSAFFYYLWSVSHSLTNSFTYLDSPPVGQSPSAHDFYTHLFPSLLFYTEEKQIRLSSVIIELIIWLKLTSAMLYQLN